MSHYTIMNMYSSKINETFKSHSMRNSKEKMITVNYCPKPYLIQVKFLSCSAHYEHERANRYRPTGIVQRIILGVSNRDFNRLSKCRFRKKCLLRPSTCIQMA